MQTGGSITVRDDNINYLRKKYTEGLTFVVGDTHGESATLKALMEKIKFEPNSDHVFFVGDYKEGRNPTSLLKYISNYYQPDYSSPGFHLIRGNYERELAPNLSIGKSSGYYCFQKETIELLYRSCRDGCEGV